MNRSNIFDGCKIIHHFKVDDGDKMHCKLYIFENYFENVHVL